MNIKFINGFVYNSSTKRFVQKDFTIEGKHITETPTITNKVIDLVGKYITPSFIDPFTQVGLNIAGVRWEGDESYEPLIDNPLDALQLDVIDGIYPFDPSFEKALKSGITTAHVVTNASQLIGSKTAIIRTTGKTVDQMIFTENKGITFSMGDIPRKSFQDKTNTPLTRMGIARHFKLLIHHLKQHNISLPLYVRCHRTDDIETALRISSEYNYPITLVHATEFKFIDKKWNNTQLSIIAGPTFQAIERNELKKLHPSLFKLLIDKQIPFALASDHPTSAIEKLKIEAILGVREGIHRDEIIHHLTTAPATLLNIHSLTGSLEENLLADFIIWDDHPIEWSTKIEAVYMEGKCVVKEGVIQSDSL